jgi:hypothetical protein
MISLFKNIRGEIIAYCFLNSDLPLSLSLKSSHLSVTVKNLCDFFKSAIFDSCEAVLLFFLKC